MRQKYGRSGIYLLPNLLTTASLFAAFYSIVASLKGQYDTAVLAIFVGMVADGLDGRIARMTNTESAFGAEYDSLSDMVTFGVAPALLLYSWSLQQFGKIGWLIAFTYTASVALRLARFNTQAEVADKRYFQGLNCTFGAAFISSFVGLCQRHMWSFELSSILSAMIAVLTAILMVSNIRYYSFKDVDFKGKVPFLYVLVVVMLFVAIAADPTMVVFAISLSYALLGPFQILFALHRMRKIRKKHAKLKKREKA